MSPKRPGTAADRDGMPRKTPPAGIAAQLAAPEPWEDDDATDRYERQEIDETELAVRRGMRKPIDWLASLQRNQDALRKEHNEYAKATTDTLTKVQVEVGKLSGQLSVLPDLVRSVKDSADRLTAREDQTLRNRLEIDKAEELARIDLTTDARKARRKFYLTVACSLVSGGGLTWLLRYLGVL